MKYIVFTILIYVFLCLITPYISVLKNRSIENQINYLSNILDNGYDNELQNRYPEGKLFSNAILAISTIEYCNKKENFGKKYSTIVDRCIQRIQSHRATQHFNPNLIPKYGMFYNGWLNLVCSTYKESQLFKYSNMQANVRETSSKIENRIYNTLSDRMRLLDSYAGASWPADNLVAISSISHDSLQAAWIKVIFKTATHDSGLIHHEGSEPSVIRGSSNALITYCLGQSEYRDIEKYNEVFHSVFIDEYLAVQLVKENEDGSNSMDVDSGPVVLGYGVSATIMNIKTQASLGNTQSKFTWAAMNTIALPVNVFNKKYYLLKKEPMLDLFMLWASTELP